MNLEKDQSDFTWAKFDPNSLHLNVNFKRSLLGTCGWDSFLLYSTHLSGARIRRCSRLPFKAASDICLEDST